MKRVLVAGSTGYLGGFVCRELAARGHFVRALARSPEKLAPLRDSLDEIVEAEITQPETLGHICDGIDVVFSSVGITRQKDGLTFRDVDYQGNKNLLEAALRAQVRKCVDAMEGEPPDVVDRIVCTPVGTAPRTVSVAESHPRTITASWCFAAFSSFLRRREVHMHMNHWW